MEQIRHFLSPPVFPDDEHKTRIARVLNTLIWGTLALLICAVAGIVFVYVEKIITSAIIVTIFSLLLFARWLLRRGRVRLASVIFITTLWIAFTVVIFFGQGMRSPFVAFYVAVTVIAGTLLGPTAALTHAAISSLTGLGMVLIEASGTSLPVLFPTPARTGWFNLTQSLILAIVALDLTLRGLNNALARARRSESHFRTLVEQAGDAVFLADFDGRFIDVNRSACQSVGYSREELLKLEVQDVAPNFDLQKLRILWSELEPGEPILLETVHRHRDGNTFPVEIRIGLLELEDQQLILGLARDITERRRAAEALRESEVRHRTLFETANDAILIMEADTFTDCNEAAIRMFGCEEKGDIIGRKPWAFSPAEQPDGQRSKQKGETLIEVALGGTAQSFEWKHTRKDGTPFDAEVSLKSLVIGGKLFLQAIVRDVTERKLAEAEVIRAKEEWERTFDAVPDLIAILDDQYRIVRANKAMADQLGVSVQDAMGLTCYECVHGSEEPPPFCPQRRLLVDGQEHTAEVFEDRLSGDFVVTVSPIYDPAGDLIGSVHVAHDITERKREENVQAAQLRLIEYATTHSVKELLREFLNEAEALTGSEIGFYHFVDDDQKTLALQTWSTNTLENMCTAEGTGLHYPIAEAGVWVDCVYEHRAVIHNDYTSLPHKKGMPEGHAPVIRELVVPVFRGERIMAILGVGNKPTDYDEHDVRAVQRLADLAWETVVRRRAEEALREHAHRVEQILSTVPAGVLLVDTEGLVLQTNPLAESDLIVLATAGIGDVLTHLGDRRLAELLAVRPGGLWHEVKAGDRTFEVIARPMEAEQTPLDGKDHRPQEWVLVVNEVTREREIQKHIQQQDRLAAVGQLAAGIAHDFNNIIAVIVLYAQMVLSTPDLPPETYKRMETVAQQAKQATALIQQILDFSRRSVLERRAMDLTPFLKEIFKLLERTMPENVKLSLNYGPGEYMVNADPTRMQQTILNLVFNARDAMPDGGELHIELSRVSAAGEVKCSICGEPIEGEWICVTVADTGTGIPPHVLPYIFDPFFTTKPSGRGTGLGLSQVYGIVRQHEGHINLTTEVGGGTSFTIYLPALLIHRSEEVAVEAQAVVQGQGEIILVVEDGQILREALVASLASMNYQTLEATNGHEALNTLERRTGEVALVLSDLVMPEMGGRELFNVIRQRGLTVPVVMLTGHIVDDQLQDLQAQGLAGWMLKPPNINQLSQLLAQILKTD